MVSLLPKTQTHSASSEGNVDSTSPWEECQSHVVKENRWDGSYRFGHLWKINSAICGWHYWTALLACVWGSSSYTLYTWDSKAKRAKSCSMWESTRTEFLEKFRLGKSGCMMCYHLEGKISSNPVSGRIQTKHDFGKARSNRNIFCLETQWRSMAGWRTGRKSRPMKTIKGKIFSVK